MISAADQEKAKVLIIDDQKLHLHFLEKILKDQGYKNIYCLSDPLKAASVTAELQPDILVLDMGMPQLDGFQIIRQLAEYRENHYLPILALSTDSSSNERIQALQSGATDVIGKPYENVEILSRIRNMLEMRILNWQVENQNKILDIKVKDKTKELRDTQLDVIRRLAQAAEFRDSGTGAHIIRMSQYCAKLGQRLGMDDEQCELILNASPLHDVGKIGIPDSILLKPGPLTEAEYEIMKTHTTIGAKLLAGNDSPLMKLAQEIAVTHHEKWDGTGYPNKIKAEQIPMSGQICSVCDVFDALTSKRPYKEPWTTEQAAAEIEKQKGKHFNPEIADRFLQILPEIKIIKAKYNN